jgi:sugar/nucleoside kinase (ribokinase family)
VRLPIGVVGGLSIDHIVNEPRGARFNSLGGPGLYAALGVHLVAGASARLATRLPRSSDGFRDVLSQVGVDLTYCTSTPEIPRVWILNSTRGRRLVPIEPPTGLEFEIEASDVDDPVEPQPAFFAGLSGVLYCAPDAVPQTGTPIPVGVDPDQLNVLRRGDDYWRAIAVTRAVLLPSRVQLATVAPDPRAAARALAARLRVSVVARLDVDGMFVVDESGIAWVVQDAGVEVCDTTGAGDSSAGAILAALSIGADVATAAAFGVSAARLALSDWGPDALARADPITEPFNGIHVVRQYDQGVPQVVGAT